MLCVRAAENPEYTLDEIDAELGGLPKDLRTKWRALPADLRATFEVRQPRSLSLLLRCQVQPGVSHAMSAMQAEAAGMRSRKRPRQARAAPNERCAAADLVVRIVQRAGTPNLISFSQVWLGELREFGEEVFARAPADNQLAYFTCGTRNG